MVKQLNVFSNCIYVFIFSWGPFLLIEVVSGGGGGLQRVYHRKKGPKNGSNKSLWFSLLPSVSWFIAFNTDIWFILNTDAGNSLFADQAVWDMIFNFHVWYRRYVIFIVCLLTNSFPMRPFSITYPLFSERVHWERIG